MRKEKRMGRASTAMAKGAVCWPPQGCATLLSMTWSQWHGLQPRLRNTVALRITKIIEERTPENYSLWTRQQQHNCKSELTERSNESEEWRTESGYEEGDCNNMEETREKQDFFDVEQYFNF